MLDLSAEEATRRLHGSNIDFILAADIGRLGELSRLGRDVPFYAGLLAKSAGDVARAEVLFDLARRSDSPSIRRAASEALISLLLTPIGSNGAPPSDPTTTKNARKALDIAADLVEGGDEDALTFQGEALRALGNYAALKDLYGKDGILAKTAKDRSLATIAVAKAEGADAKDLILSYFVDGPMSSEHRRTYLELQDIIPDFLDGAFKSAALGRMAIYDRAYGDALYHFRAVLAEDPSLLFSKPELLGDFGKALQYSGAETEGVELFTRWENELRDTPNRYAPIDQEKAIAIRFRLLLYAGRMKRQAGDLTDADRLFFAALPLAPDQVQRDACIWYLLDDATSLSPASAVPLLEKYAPSWNSSPYFTDVLDRLCGRLVATNNWEALFETFRIIRGIADQATIARYAYVLGRVISLGFVGADRAVEMVEGTTGRSRAKTQPIETAQRFFRIAFESDEASFYYRCLAASRLGENIDPIPAEEQANRFDPVTGDTGRIDWGKNANEDLGEKNSTDDSGKDELRFILGFFKFGCADFAMAYAQNIAKRLPSQDITTIASAFAQAERWGDSIRLIAELLDRPGYSLDRRDMELLYPRPFRRAVGEAAQRWNIPEELFFALARTESAFIPDIVSHAGAVGLAQLMPSTAKDVANRIKKLVELKFIGDEPNLIDPDTNLQLGAWYLDNMTKRTGSPLLALFAYNGGLTRVRRWRASQPDIPEDLFLETVEIAETRDYGRKVLAAAAVYGYLYYGMTLERVIADIFPQ